MKKFLVFAAITILLVGSIFSQNNVNPNLMTKQRQRAEEIQMILRLLVMSSSKSK